MSSQNLLRLSGNALLAGSVLYIISDVLNIVFNSQSSDAPPPFVAILGLIATMLLIMGLPGFLVRQARKVGTLGLIGWIVFLCSAMLGIGLLANAAAFLPAMPAQNSQAAQDAAPPVSILAFILAMVVTQLVGGILLGIATIRAHVFSPWIGWLLIVSSVVSAAAFPLEGMVNTVVITLSDLLLFIALGWIGHNLTRTSQDTAQEALSSTRTVGA
jgi:hypothetical protein